MLQDTDKEVVRKCGEQKTAAGRSAERILKGVPTRLVAMAMSISRAIPKWCLRDVSKMDYFSENLSRIWTGRSEQSSKGEVDITGGECMIPLDPFSLVRVDIYKRSFTAEGKVLV